MYIQLLVVTKLNTEGHLWCCSHDFTPSEIRPPWGIVHNIYCSIVDSPRFQQRATQGTASDVPCFPFVGRIFVCNPKFPRMVQWCSNVQCRYTNQVIANGFRLIRHPNTVGYLRRLDCAHHAGSMVGNVVWWEVKGGYRIGYIPKPSTNVSPLGLWV